MSDTYVIEIPGPLVSLNAERRQRHWAVRSEATKQWRHSAGWAAKAAKIPPLSVVIVEAQPWQSKGVLADAGNHLPSVKAAIDGLVDVGVLHDDDPTHVAALILLAPRRGNDGLTLTVQTVAD
jgi:crossover junction endodeoxyribonuclease RusA